MGIESLVIWLIVGGVGGWLAGLVFKGGGFGIVGNIVLGIVGAALAGFLLPMVGLRIGGGIIAGIVNAAIGSAVILVLIGLIKRR